VGDGVAEIHKLGGDLSGLIRRAVHSPGKVADGHTGALGDEGERCGRLLLLGERLGVLLARHRQGLLLDVGLQDDDAEALQAFALAGQCRLDGARRFGDGDVVERRQVPGEACDLFGELLRRRAAEA